MSGAASQFAFSFEIPDTIDFESFLPSGNHEPYQYLVGLAERPERGLVYLWGPEGSGKSHLLQALCRELARGGLGAAYLPLNQAGELDPVITEGLEGLHCVCLDAIDAIAGDSRWEHAVFDLFNRLRERERILVIAGRRNPRTLPVGLADLHTRLLWGLTFHLQPLVDEAKMRAVRERARRRGFEISDDAASYLIRRAPRDMGSLFRILDSLDRASLAAQRRVTIPFIRELLFGSTDDSTQVGEFRLQT
jgi:DnaA family protein